MQDQSDDEEEEEDNDQEEEFSSSAEDDSGSDFEEASQTRKGKAAAAQKKPRQSRAIDRIPIIKPRKSGAAYKAKAPRVSKTAAFSGAKGTKASASVKKRSVEDVDESEGQSELYGNVLNVNGSNLQGAELRRTHTQICQNRCSVRLPGGS